MEHDSTMEAGEASVPPPFRQGVVPSLAAVDTQPVQTTPEIVHENVVNGSETSQEVEGKNGLVDDTIPVEMRGEAQPGEANVSTNGKMSFVKHWCINYFTKWKGVKDMRSPNAPRHVSEYVSAFIGSFGAIAILAAIHYNVQEISEAALAGLIASFGATAVLLYATPSAPLAQPRNLILGHTLSALVGVTIRVAILDAACDGQCIAVASALAVSLSIVLMMATVSVHPPGGATALIAVVGDSSIKQLGYLYVVMPVLFGAVVMLLVALAVNNATSSRRYPQYWW